jgi:phosphate transport system substrate-binding protein
MRKYLLPVFLPLLLGIGRLPAQNLDDLPPYKADGRQFGEIRTWGNEAMANVLRLWEVSIFEGSYQRGLRFVDTLPSGACAIGALYTGVADLGAMGHHCWPIELEGFRQVYGYDPLEITVATGAYDVPGKMPPNVIFVSKDNPLSRLTLQQVDGIFGEQRTGGWQGRAWSTASARDATANLRTWGQLGLTGEWADKPIHVYGFDLTGSSFPFSMQRMVFGGGGKWNPELREFVLNEIGLIYGGGPRPRQGTEVLADAVANDRYAISYASSQYIRQNPQLKAIALANTAGGPYVEPTKANMLNRSYPLVESIYVYINRPPGQPVEPKLREFLRYILSREGQRAVAEDGGYLPLPAEVVREQLEKLN